MTLAMVALIWLFFTRLPQPIAALPDRIALPEGTTVEAVTQGRGFLLVVTSDGEILVFDPEGDTIRQRIALDP